jgi:hypothetical protein
MQSAFRFFQNVLTSAFSGALRSYPSIKKNLFLLPLLFFFSGKISAQTGTVSGTIRDSLSKPLFGVTVSIFGKPIGTSTDETGFYSLSVPSGQELKIIFSYTGLNRDSVIVNLKENEKLQVNKKLSGRVKELGEVTVREQPMKGANITHIDPKVISVLPTINRSVEDILKTLPGVSSANELSSTYSVRGGNYDENLVYVNDVEIYRPLLVRSGQQEGLSFINPDMVETINFSAGGFDAIYGDKLSSVLDIKYRKPKRFGFAVSGSLLGASLEMEDISKNKKWTAIGGIRYKSNAYLFNTFETKGEYNPNFIDAQFLTTFEASKKFSIEVLGNYARNIYNLVPETRETNFGTITDAKRFTVFFEGREADRYETFTGAVSGIYKPTEKLKLKLIASGYHADEQENFDILGQYFLDQLEADLGKEEFGNVLFNLGVGSFLNHARNRLKASVYTGEHKGELVGNKSLLQWGIKAQHEEIDDKLNEWYYLDSAGFSIPSYRDPVNPQILLNDVVNAKNSLASNRLMGYLQDSWQLADTGKLMLTVGVRANYWDLNSQLVISPRMSLFYKHKNWKQFNMKFAAGYYYQPPFYRELRDLQGVVHPELLAQQSIHLVLGSDYYFLALGREFKLTSEIYYKFLDDLIPYKIDNLRIRYLAKNNSKGYARGIDLRLFGDFVPGVESWASLSFLQTQEDLSDDYYYIRVNEQGDTILKGYTYDQVAVDSHRVEPGYIPRPTDQIVNFGVFFQDYFKKWPSYKMQLVLLFGSKLPFGPPGPDRYKDVLRMPTYRRVDIGFSKQIIGEDVKRPPKIKFLRKFEAIWISLEVFNLLQVSNVSSYIWITDVTNDRKYAVPNYLTGRQLNLRLNFKF